MRFHLIRLVLLKREQGDIFDDWEGKLPDLETWLRRVFSREIKFAYRKVQFHYVPDPDPEDGILSGRIGRQRLHKENEPPEAGLKETERLHWLAATVVIDPTHHDDGQKVAMQVLKEIGKPSAVMRALASSLNTTIPPEPYALEAASIIDPATFWKFVEDNEGEITSVTFELFAPNMFGVRTSLDREMHELKENEKAQKVQMTLENEEGLHLNTERTKETAEYTAEGGGSIHAWRSTARRPSG